jgi:hypothetical protein
MENRDRKVLRSILNFGRKIGFLKKPTPSDLFPGAFFESRQQGG